MKTKTAHYKPINCDFYDTLALAIMMRQKFMMGYTDENGKFFEETVIMYDLISKNGEEFAILENGTRVRLDRITRIDGRDVDLSC